MNNVNESSNAYAIVERAIEEMKGEQGSSFSLLCALDRIFDDATVFNIRGESFRGKKLDTVTLQTSRVKAPTPAADRQRT